MWHTLFHFAADVSWLKRHARHTLFRFAAGVTGNCVIIQAWHIHTLFHVLVTAVSKWFTAEVYLHHKLLHSVVSVEIN